MLITKDPKGPSIFVYIFSQTDNVWMEADLPTHPLKRPRTENNTYTLLHYLYMIYLIQVLDLPLICRIQTILYFVFYANEII